MARWRSGLRRLPALLGAGLLFLALFAVRRTFHDLRFTAVVRALHAIPRESLLLASLFTILSYAGLTLYDTLGTRYAGSRVGYRRIAFASFCAYALSHSLGFAVVAGAAVRYRLYAQWGLTTHQIKRVIAFCSLSFGLGGLVLGGAILFLTPRAVPLLGRDVPLPALWALGALLWGVVGTYVGLAWLVGTLRLFGHRIALPGLRIALAQVALATADLALTGTIFWVLLPPLAGLGWLAFMGIYVATYSAGLAANVPGGLGVFDGAIVFGLSPFLPAPRIVAVIVVYRLCYYVIPLFLAGTLFAANEAVQRGAALFGAQKGTQKGPRTAGTQAPAFGLTAVIAASALSGTMLLGFAVLTPLPGAGTMPAGLGALAPSLLGAALLVLSAALVRRVRMVWWLTLLCLALGTVLLAHQGGPGWIVLVLAASAAMLVPFRSRFYRPASWLGGRLDGSAAAAVLALAVGILGLVSFRAGHGLEARAWWRIVLAPGAPMGLRVSVALTVIPGLLALWFLLRPGRIAPGPWGAAAQARCGIAPTLPEPDGVIWGEAAAACLPFRRLGRVVLGYGDPVGAATDQISAIWRLCDFAAQEGCHPAFWRAGTAFLAIYADLGLTAVPLTRDGLPAETDDPAAQDGLYLVCAAERDLDYLTPRLKLLAGAS